MRRVEWSVSVQKWVGDAAILCESKNILYAQTHK